MTSDDIPIWDDPDVMRIYRMQDGQPHPMFHVFNDEPAQLALILDFVESDRAAGSDGPAEAFVAVCLAGVRAVESLAASVDPGWLKFFIYMIDMNNHFLWDLYRRSTEVAAIAEWTVETIEQHRWGPDGNSTPLGQRHSNAMALAAAAGGGVRLNPAIGRFEYGNGDRARQAARDGGFTRPVSAGGLSPAVTRTGDVRACVWMTCSLRDKPTSEARCPECGILTEPKR